MNDEVTGAAPHRPSPGGGFEETEARRRRLVQLLQAVALVAVVGVLVSAFVPRTVAEGEQDGRAWSLRVSPGILAPTVQVEVDGTRVEVDDLGAPAALGDTSVVQLPADDPAVTVVVGPTPRGAESVRVTSLERGVGAAEIERVAWRRVHLEVLPGDAWVTDLVAIAGDGGVLDTVRELPPPGTADEGATDEDATGGNATG